MRIMFTAALAVVFAPFSAGAAERFSDSQFLHAARCAALSDVPALKAEAVDTAWLADAMKDQRRGREDFILQKARDNGRDIAMSGRRANTEVKIAALRAERAQACASFKTGMDSAGVAGTPPG